MGKSTKPSCCHGDWPLVFPTKHVWHTSAGGFFRQNSKQMGWSRIRPCLCLRCQLFLTISWKSDAPKSECHANQFRRYTNPLGCQKRKISLSLLRRMQQPFRQCHDWEQSYHYDNSKKDSCIDPAMVHIDLIPTNNIVTWACWYTGQSLMVSSPNSFRMFKFIPHGNIHLPMESDI